jgi:hypothetical protein
VSTATTSAERREKLRAALHLPEPLAAIALFVLSTACAALLLVRGRAVEPYELPSLELSASEVARAIAADVASARGAPRGKTADGLRGLLTHQGEMELVGAERYDIFNKRRAALAKGFATLVTEVGESKALGLRAEATCELDAALDLKLPLARAKIVVGSLGQMLEREGASVDGELTAPRFVARTLFKARWNLLHGLAPTHRFERIERQAYFGWEALHAERLPIPQRVEALGEYAKVGGKHIDEAHGVLLYQHQEYQQAATALRAAYNAEPSLRLRNYVLGAQAHE